MAERKKKLQLTTPVGTAIWPRLNEPNRRWKPEGEYTTTLKLSREEAGGFIAELDAQIEENYAAACASEKKKAVKRADPPYKMETDDTGAETGNVLIKFSLKARVEPRNGEPFDQKPALCDAKRKPLNARIGGGSRIKVACKVNPWFTAALGAGVSLWCVAVQVLELVGPGGDMAAYGFADEDGYTSEPDDVSSEPAASGTTGTVAERKGDF